MMLSRQAGYSWLPSLWQSGSIHPSFSFAFGHSEHTELAVCLTSVTSALFQVGADLFTQVVTVGGTGRGENIRILT